VDDGRAERLNAAIDDLVAGRGSNGAASGLPESLRPLLATAAALCARRRGGGPRPSFVLGLEEQLRADLRLAAPIHLAGARRIRVRQGVWLACLAVVLLGLGAAGVYRQRASSPIAPWPDATTAGRYRPLDSQAERYLDRGWQTLLLFDSASESDPTMTDERRALLEELVSSYTLALQAIEAARDGRLALRAASELRAARQTLGSSAHAGMSPMLVASLRLATAELDSLVERADELADRLVVLTGPTSPPTDVARSTQVAGAPDATTSSATSEPAVTEAAVPSATAVAGSTDAPATASIAPTATSGPAASVTAVRSLPAPTGIPPQPLPATGVVPTEPGAAPRGTPALPTPTGTADPGRDPASPTPDRWPVTSTPLPPSPRASVVVTAPPGIVTSVPAPTAEPTAQAPSNPASTSSNLPDWP